MVTSTPSGSVIAIPTLSGLRDDDAELSLLGALIEIGHIPPEVRATGIKPQDFTAPKRGDLFRIMADSDGRGHGCDLTAVAAIAQTAGWTRLELRDMQANVTIATNAPRYAEMVVRTARRRELDRMGERLRAAAADPRTDPDEMLATMRAELAAVQGQGPATRARTMDLATFAYGLDDTLPAAWGQGSEVLWSPGEPLLIVGPDGVGKTTLAQRIALARAGVGSGAVLGYPVAPARGRVLYVSADRPRQARRSLRRMITEDEAASDRLVFWPGPLPFDLVAEPGRLATWAEDLDVTDVVLDSLGVLVSNLASDETGGALARAFTEAVAAGIELVVNHHQRKASGDNKKPNTLSDVYGSRWITSSAGSVLMLWGDAGDPVVKVTHLKQPSEPVGPFQVSIDHEAGTVEVVEGTDLLGILRAAPKGLTAQEAGTYLDGAEDKAKTNKARRKLDRFVVAGVAYAQEPDKSTGRGAITPAKRYFATPHEGHQEPLG